MYAGFEPVDFFIATCGASDILLDRVELYPEDHIEGSDPEIVQLTKDWEVPLTSLGTGHISYG